MAFKIYLNTTDWATKEAEYHGWMQANVLNYSADCWAKVAWNKHPALNKWHLLIPKGHPDAGEELTNDWKAEE